MHLRSDLDVSLTMEQASKLKQGEKIVCIAPAGKMILGEEYVVYDVPTKSIITVIDDEGNFINASHSRFTNVRGEPYYRRLAIKNKEKSR